MKHIEVKNAPGNFIEWAKSKGAFFEKNHQEWIRLIQQSGIKPPLK